MLTQDLLRSLATQYHTSDYPNTVREYVQHVFLSTFYKRDTATNLLFKGGTALRVVYGSPRFSEDLDFSLFSIVPHERQRIIEDLFQDTMIELHGLGINVEFGEKFGPTADGYFGSARATLYDYPPVTIEINISARNGRSVQGQAATIANDFVPTYNLLHLPQDEIVEEKIFGALLERHKARDFYDLYFIMRKGLLTLDQKRRLATVKDQILALAQGIQFDAELGTLLPADQQLIIKDFERTLAAELERQLADL